jgi:hypothetical protein
MASDYVNYKKNRISNRIYELSFASVDEWNLHIKGKAEGFAYKYGSFSLIYAHYFY